LLLRLVDIDVCQTTIRTSTTTQPPTVFVVVQKVRVLVLTKLLLGSRYWFCILPSRDRTFRRKTMPFP
jgi:hypothetical protein